MINIVSINKINSIISGNDTRRERFIAYDKSKWVAIDNTTGDAWTESFIYIMTAIKWLMKNNTIASDLQNDEKIIRAFKRDLTVSI